MSEEIGISEGVDMDRQERFELVVEMEGPAGAGVTADGEEPSGSIRRGMQR